MTSLEQMRVSMRNANDAARNNGNLHNVLDQLTKDGQKLLKYADAMWEELTDEQKERVNLKLRKENQ